MVKIAVVIPMFDFAGDPWLLRNHRTAVAELSKEPRVDVFTSRAILEGKCRDRFTVRTRSVLWHKEGLVNRAVRLLWRDYPIIAWIDNGVTLSPGWSDRLRVAIDGGCNVVQLFSRGEWLDPHGTPERRGITTNHWGYVCGTQNGMDPFVARPKFSAGMAWAATSRVLHPLPLYDRAIVGGGDTWWICGTMACDMPEALVSRYQSEAQRMHLSAWLRRARSKHLRVGWIDGAYRHLWHTDTMHRQHNTRHQILAESGYDPARHTRIGQNGLVEWTDSAPAGMVERVRAFVLGRAATA